MNNIKRYDEELHGFSKSNMVTDQYGMWVTYDEAASTLAAKDAEIASIKDELASIAKGITDNATDTVWESAGRTAYEALCKIIDKGPWTLTGDDSHWRHHYKRLVGANFDWQNVVATARREALEDCLSLAAAKSKELAESAYPDRVAKEMAHHESVGAIEVHAAIRALIAAPKPEASEATTIDQLIREIQAWQRQVFPNATVGSTSEHLRREAIELASEPEDTSEAVDVFFLLTGWIQCRGLSLPEFAKSVREKWEVNKARTWGKPDAHGVIEHIDASEPSTGKDA